MGPWARERTLLFYFMLKLWTKYVKAAAVSQRVKRGQALLSDSVVVHGTWQLIAAHEFSIGLSLHISEKLLGTWELDHKWCCENKVLKGDARGRVAIAADQALGWMNAVSSYSRTQDHDRDQLWMTGGHLSIDLIDLLAWDLEQKYISYTITFYVLCRPNVGSRGGAITSSFKVENHTCTSVIPPTVHPSEVTVEVVCTSGCVHFMCCRSKDGYIPTELWHGRSDHYVL